MRIGFDAKRFFRNATGLGNYSRGLVYGLAEQYPDHTYHLYHNKSTAEVAPPLYTKSPSSIIGQKLGGYWRSYGVYKDINRDQLDIYHGLSNEMPFARSRISAKMVVTIHDLIFVRYPQYYSHFDTRMHIIKTRYAARHADRIVAISEQTKQDLIHYYHADPDKIEVVYQTCDPVFESEYGEKERKHTLHKLNIHRPYLLYVGRIEQRKNLQLIIDTLSEFTELDLVVVGRPTSAGRSYYKQILNTIEAQGLSQRVHFVRGISNTELAMIYQSAMAFVYPSYFEGFGIPILEGLHAGTLVISSDRSCLSEVGADAVYYIDPDRKDQLAQQIQAIQALNSEQRKVQIQKGKARASTFTRTHMAEQMMRLYKAVL